MDAEIASGAAESSAALIVIAKEPAVGRAKTRLQPSFTPTEAGRLAGASVRDTLRAARAVPGCRKILCWQGFGADPASVTDGLSDDFVMIAQESGGLAERLAGAFTACWSGLEAEDDHPALLIGMDTPQVSPNDLDVDWRGADALLGLAPDGGFWAIGLRRCDAAAIFAGVAMSTEQTGAAQLARLHALGLRVRLLRALGDVDTAADAAVVATRHPALEFSRVHRHLIETAPGQVFDQIHTGTAVEVDDRGSGGSWDPSRWHAAADAVDAEVAARCTGATLDLGCGPGRLVVLLLSLGIPALGVDVSAAAVRCAHRRGAQALRADLHDPLPLEGKWSTVVLLDCNIGLGDDVPALLRRTRELLAPGGRLVCEVDSDPEADSSGKVRLCGTADDVPGLSWGRAGTVTVTRVAAVTGFSVVEHWAAGDRTFLTLEKLADLDRRRHGG